MTAVVTGLSHHTAAHPVLERLALTSCQAVDVLGLLARSPDPAEAVVLATCNRVEVYLESDRPER
ncbi:glutamyl-tRNA reductase, partial [Streptomyces sp. SCA2-4]|nr:glutamyl-tRNA reductase [Streptomyces huiliensis]